ncbi:hypothetical protein AMECASPLE_012182 [Ameca splendens]|uniref:Uncharacterized protein n=1 Tax=Ameca splendens TaxID=208324 RepID=A0ABV1A7B2_9TELE
MILWIRLSVDGNYHQEAKASQHSVLLMGFVEYFGRRLGRISRFFCRFPKVIRRSGRLEVGPLWRESAQQHREARKEWQLWTSEV